MMSNESSLSQMSESAMSSDDAGFDSSLDPGSGYTLFESMLIAVIAGILSFLTIAGNVLVMVSFKLDKQLQTISNYFLLSLAGELEERKRRESERLKEQAKHSLSLSLSS